MGMLISTEKRLAKNAKHAEVYQKQIEDMIEREVARKLSHTELENYKGSIHYISHHEVLKPASKSTPVRIVFNSSARYMNHSLNDYWAKGPHLLNDLLGILIRFRENRIALIIKCYHIVDSQIVHGMIQKESYGFNTFAATRVGEIQQNTSPKEWFWMERNSPCFFCRSFHISRQLCCTL